MSDVNELIEVLRKIKSYESNRGAEYNAVWIRRAIANLEAEHAEAERLRGERDEWKRLFSDCHPIHLDGVLRARKAEAENAHLTARLQAVREASEWAKEHGMDSVDTYRLDSILDAALEGGE